MRKIRLFISSPGDVGEERRITEATVERLQFRYAGRVDFEACLWEHLPMRASAGFQQQIRAARECFDGRALQRMRGMHNGRPPAIAGQPA
ncbi:MAG: hypothetical protein ACR2FY_11820 [Pirellulaceae bacterium]